MEIAGVAPKLLLEQVLNTAPFIFEHDSNSSQAEFGFLQSLESVRDGKEEFSLPEYFELAISAHFSTVATFIPTDMDQTIRQKLWQKASAEEAEIMAGAVDKFLLWKDDFVSVRQVFTRDEQKITGHHGEWFSIAIPAFLSLQRFKSSLALKILDRILWLLAAHEKAFKKLLEEGNFIKILKASTLIAHNLGDLDRVIDLWNVPKESALRLEIYQLGHRRGGAYPHLFFAGELNKAMMAEENHRHYPLRKARVLKRNFDFLLGMAPFFDSWGATLARHPDLENHERIDIVETLIDGWCKMNTSRAVYGYARALAGIFSATKGGANTLLDELPAAKRKLALGGNLRAMLSVDQRTFEISWAKRAEKFYISFSLQNFQKGMIRMPFSGAKSLAPK